MGISEKSALGDVSGKVGRETRRERYGKTVVYRECQDFHKSESEASKANRNKFGMLGKFARTVKAFPELEAIWRSAKNIKAHAPINRIEQVNAKYMGPGRPTINSKIIPEKGFKCRVNSLAFDQTGIKMEIKPESLDEKVIPFIKYYSALFVIGLYDSEDKAREYCTMLGARSELEDCEPEKLTNIYIPFNEEEAKLISGYKEWILYFVLIIKNEEGEVLGNSVSFASEFDFSLTDNTGVLTPADKRPRVKFKLSDQWAAGIKPEKFMLTENFYKNEQGENIFEFVVKEPEEIVMWVMSLGKGVEVLEPSGLRVKVKELAKDVLGNYGNK